MAPSGLRPRFPAKAIELLTVDTNDVTEITLPAENKPDHSVAELFRAQPNRTQPAQTGQGLESWCPRKTPKSRMGQ
jgi:hypothetical protein